MLDDPLLPFFCFFLLLVVGVGAGAGDGAGAGAGEEVAMLAVVAVAVAVAELAVGVVVVVVVEAVLLPVGVLGGRGGEGAVLSPADAVEADRFRLPSLSDMVPLLVCVCVWFPGGKKKKAEKVGQCWVYTRWTRCLRLNRQGIRRDHRRVPPGDTSHVSGRYPVIHFVFTLLLPPPPVFHHSLVYVCAPCRGRVSDHQWTGRGPSQGLTPIPAGKTRALVEDGLPDSVDVIESKSIRIARKRREGSAGRSSICLV